MAKTFSTQYCVCVRDDGSPREISRTGSVVTYKAVDYRTGLPVALEVIPAGNVEEASRLRCAEEVRRVQKLGHVNIARIFDVRLEDEHLVIASEFLLGETADHWVVAHGPMPTDAVLRVALQVVNALADAIFHGLTHRALQPSNLMIVPGAGPDGGWPFVKLLHFGLAGLKLYAEDNTATELVPPIAPQFASPEQLASGVVDFRSEVFSLGALSCFLLTGAVPLVGRANATGAVERILPRGAHMPRSVRHLLGRMLRSDPAARPQDPVALAEELRETLQKVERRGIFDRALMPVIRGPEKKRRVLSARRALPIGLAVAAILLVAGLVNAVAPNRLRTLLGKERPITAIGVPIGVPEGSEIPPPSNPLPSATVEQRVTTQASPPGSPATLTSNVLETATSPSAAAAPANVVAIASPPATTVAREQAQPESPPLNAMNAPAASAQASPGESVEPAPPAEGPAPSPAAARKATRNFADQTIWRDAIAENANQPANAPADHSSSGKRDESSSTAAASPEGAKSPTAGNAIRKSSTRNKRVVSAGKPKHSLPPLRVGDSRAQFVGTNSKGNWVLRLPSGETVVTPPAPNPDSAPIEKHGRVRRVQGPPLEDHSADPPVMADPVHE